MSQARIHCDLADSAERMINPTAAMDFVQDPAHGGCTQFVGTVRNHNQGKQAIGISYQIFAPLALRVFQRAAEQALSDYDQPMRIFIEHAHGRLAVGDVAVVVSVSTPHRDEAFRACRDIIETVKHAAPIWKQEHYADGDSEWSQGCSLCGHRDQAANKPAHEHEHSRSHDHDHSHEH